MTKKENQSIFLYSHRDNEVECEEAIIDGHVTGHFICRGKLHLKKKAVLNGNIVVANMTIDKGARHNGQISIQQ